MEGEGGRILSAVETLAHRMVEYMRTHGLPSPRFRIRADGGSRVVLESVRDRTFPRRLECVFTPPTYTVMVEGFVITYDTFSTSDGLQERILRTLFDVILEYVMDD